MRIGALLLAGLLHLPAAAQNIDWQVGEEVETAPGVYQTLVARDGDWSVWKYQNSADWSCVAILRKEGGDHTWPTEKYGHMYGSTVSNGSYPYLLIQPFLTRSYGDRASGNPMYAGGTYSGKVTWELRPEGERFFQRLVPGTQSMQTAQAMSAYAGQRIEVMVTSWEFPNLMVGQQIDKGTFHIVDMDKAIETLERCKRSG